MRNRGELRPIHPAAQDPEAGYQSPCVHVFGDVGCGINLAAFTTSGVVVGNQRGRSHDHRVGVLRPGALTGRGYFRRGNDYG